MKNFTVLIKEFNWRYLLVRLLVSALALIVTTALLPNIYFKDYTLRNIIVVTLGLSILNALIKPILQFLTLSFIFATYGLVVALINGILLYLLSYFFPERFVVDSFFWAIVGGVLLGLMGSFFESLLGLTVPIVPEDRPELRQQLARQTTNFAQLIVKARTERGAGLMGEEITEVLAGTHATAALAANSASKDDTVEPPPVASADVETAVAIEAAAPVLAVVSDSQPTSPATEEEQTS